MTPTLNDKVHWREASVRNGELNQCLQLIIYILSSRSDMSKKRDPSAPSKAPAILPIILLLRMYASRTSLLENR